MSAQTTLVNALKNNFLPLPADTYGKETKRSAEWRHQVNAGKNSFDRERVWALGALHSFRSKKKLAAEKQHETHFVSNGEKQKWIEDYVERETARARNRVEDVEAAVQQEQEDMKHAQIVG